MDDELHGPDTDHDDLIARLRAVGRTPVEPAVQSAHLTALATAKPSGLRPKLRVAAAFLAGLLVGGSGLAVAGALPDPAQNVAHGVFEQIGVEVPLPERYHGPECGDEVERNHGGYVSKDRAYIGTDCGKPVQALGGGDGEDEGDDDGERGPGGPKGPCQGPPPWALDRTMTAEEKAAAQAERRSTCGEDAAVDESEQGEADDQGAPADPGVTTTTAAPTTTTTAAPTTTTTAPPSTTEPAAADDAPTG